MRRELLSSFGPIATAALALMMALTARADVNIDEATFPDANFRNWLLRQSYGKDGIITNEEINGITRITVGNIGLTTLEGIKVFVALTYLSCSMNQLTMLDVSGCTALSTLECCHNQLKALDVSECTALSDLNCYDNQLKALDVSGCTTLSNLNCYDNQLEVLNVSRCTKLQRLSCYNNQLTELNVSECSALQYMACNNNLLTALDVSQCTELLTLLCNNNNIRSAAMDNLIAGLNDRNPINYPLYVYIQKEGYFRVYYQAADDEPADGNVCTREQVAQAKAKNWKVEYAYRSPNNPNIINFADYEGSDPEGEIDLVIDEKTFPDANFRAWLLAQDYGQDGLLTVEEILEITWMEISDRQIKSLEGIQIFTALKYLNCNQNQLTTLDVSGCTALNELLCSYNKLTSLDVSGCSSLKVLYCMHNQLTELDVSECTAMQRFACSNNQLATLDVSRCIALEELGCYQNQISGEAMDELVASLSDRSDEYYEGVFVVFREASIYDNASDHNICTKEQVKKAKAKNWIVYYFYPEYIDDVTWYKTAEYEGAEAESISGIEADDNMDAPLYDLAGRRLGNKPMKKGIYLRNGKKILYK